MAKTTNPTPSANNAAHDGTLSLARRMGADSKWYYHGLLSRDGVYAQILPVDRCAKATEGYSQVVPGLPKTENNRLGYQVAWANLGWTTLNGQAPFKDAKGEVLPVDPDRADLVKVGTKLWQQPTLLQARAAGGEKNRRAQPRRLERVPNRPRPAGAGR